MISAKIVADSVSQLGKRITTLQLCYPRFIHSELMTHRALSRNAMSSRAVPVAKMIEQVRHNPAMPVHWGKNQPGMQAREELSGEALKIAQTIWIDAAQEAAKRAESMSQFGAHKQIVNRLLEPFQWMHTLVTATEWDNFFQLRLHPDAQPEFQALAREMHLARVNSDPLPLSEGEWHLPYVTKQEESGLSSAGLDARRISAARCARVSYLNHDGTDPDPAKDLELFDRLAAGDPIHASPLEHQALPLINSSQRSRNFVGWLQFRELYEESRA